MRLETYGMTAAPAGVRALFDRQAPPEGGWDWFEILAATTLSGPEEACVAALVNADGLAVSAVPLVMERGRVVRGLTSAFTTHFAAPLGSPQNARTLGKLVAGMAGGTLRLDALDSADTAFTAFQQGLAEGGLAVTRFRHFANWFERIDNFADYWNGRGSRLKSTVKRKAAPLLRENRLVFEQIDLAADWRRGAGIYQKIYAGSWKPDEPHPHFIEALLEKLGGRGIARLGVALIDGQPVAAQIWLVREGAATIFKLAHDPAFDRHSPGTLLTHWILRLLHERDGVREVDFGRGDDAYKRLWLSHCQAREGLLAANPRTLKGLLSVAVDILPARFKRFLRQKTGRQAAMVSSVSRTESGSP